MNHEPDDVTTYVGAAARLLGLNLDAAWVPQVAATLAVILDHGVLVERLVVPEDQEPAAVFEA